MNATIEAMKADALRGIRESRPQKNEQGFYVCQFCGSSGTNAFSIWHTCEGRRKQGIEVRIVR